VLCLFSKSACTFVSSFCDFACRPPPGQGFTPRPPKEFCSWTLPGDLFPRPPACTPIANSWPHPWTNALQNSFCTTKSASYCHELKLVGSDQTTSKELTVLVSSTDWLSSRHYTQDSGSTAEAPPKLSVSLPCPELYTLPPSVDESSEGTVAAYMSPILNIIIIYRESHKKPTPQFMLFILHVTAFQSLFLLHETKPNLINALKFYTEILQYNQSTPEAFWHNGKIH